MLSIQPDVSREGVLTACREAGIPYSSACYLYRAENRGERLGWLLFQVQADQVEVVCYRGETDSSLLDGLLRAGFHYAEKQGIRTGCLPLHFREEWVELFRALNYPGEERFNIENFFQKYKNCGTLA